MFESSRMVPKYQAISILALLAVLLPVDVLSRPSQNATTVPSPLWFPSSPSSFKEKFNFHGIPNALDAKKGRVTDVGAVFAAVRGVRQKSGVKKTGAKHFQPPTVRTAKRQTRVYDLLFNGTGTQPQDRDAAVEGTAFLTYKVIPGVVYNVPACLQFCDGTPDCVFVNLYSQVTVNGTATMTGIVCAAFADVHIANEKTDFDGRPLDGSSPSGNVTSYIQNSSGWKLRDLPVPPVPKGYEPNYGPLNAATVSAGYMGFALLDRYDVLACADLCNKRDPDPFGGACQFINIWRAVVDGAPASYTCSMYYIPSGSDLATNTGQGSLVVTDSMAYHRMNANIDSGFEVFASCDEDICYMEQSASWLCTSPPGGELDAVIAYYPPFAHSGSAAVILGSATGHDDLPGTLTRVGGRLNTRTGEQYQIQFFLASYFSGPELEADAFAEVLWNGAVVKTVRDGYSPWKYYAVDVTARGDGEDVLSFRGGKAPAWSFLDDVYVFQI